MSKQVTADMTVFEIRDTLRANGGSQVARMNFYDDAEADVTVIAASGFAAKVVRQLMDAFESGELTIGTNELK